MEAKTEINECAWCGAEILGEEYRNRTGELFCGNSHRSSSNRALKRFLDNWADDNGVRRPKTQGAPNE